MNSNQMKIPKILKDFGVGWSKAYRFRRPDTRFAHKIQSNRWFHSAHKCDNKVNESQYVICGIALDLWHFVETKPKSIFIGFAYSFIANK